MLEVEENVGFEASGVVLTQEDKLQVRRIPHPEPDTEKPAFKQP